MSDKPEDHKAESEVVHPVPATGPVIDAILHGDVQASINFAMAMGDSPMAIFEQGIMGGLAIALDHPEAVRPLLAHLDSKVRPLGIDPLQSPDQAMQQHKAGRATLMKRIADAVLGRLPFPQRNDWSH